MKAPYRIVTARLVIRCWNPVDAPLLKRAVDESVEHLRPFMAWAPAEPEDVSVVVERLRGFRARFDRDQDYALGIFSPDESQVWGATGIHDRLPDRRAREIGYWVHVDQQGKGLISEAVAALTRYCFEAGQMERMELGVNPANTRSSRVAERLGYRLEAHLRRRLERGEDRLVYSLFDDEYPLSACAKAAFEAFGAAGEPLI